MWESQRACCRSGPHEGRRPGCGRQRRSWWRELVRLDNRSPRPPRRGDISQRWRQAWALGPAAACLAERLWAAYMLRVSLRPRYGTVRIWLWGRPPPARRARARAQQRRDPTEPTRIENLWFYAVLPLRTHSGRATPWKLFVHGSFRTQPPTCLVHGSFRTQPPLQLQQNLRCNRREVRLVFAQKWGCLVVGLGLWCVCVCVCACDFQMG